jgi:hypothetical protein
VVVIEEPNRAHVLFVNEFGGNYEIYHCRWNGSSWSLPRNVSNTSGVSSSPGVDVSANGTIHVVWADNTPGYNVIYHAYWNGTYWINGPIPNAFGGAPAISVGKDDELHAVWQDRDSVGTPYEIYYSQQTDGRWSLPENLSDTRAEQSIIPSVIADAASQAHIVWQERVDGAYAVYYARGIVGHWSLPEQLSEGASEAYLPSLDVNDWYTVYVGWDEGTLAVYRQRGAVDALWSRCRPVSTDPSGVTDLQIKTENAGRIHAVWTQQTSGGRWDVYYESLAYELSLPLAVKSHRE